MKDISINVGGDLYINASSPDNNFFDNEVLQLFAESDINIINLESPVTRNLKNKISKEGPNMSGSLFTFTYLKQIKTNLVTLANNHILDFGYQGLSDTIDECNDNSIGFVGAGLTPDEAKKPFLFTECDIKIAVLNFAENEFSTPYGREYGANPMDIIENIQQIKEARKLFDIILVIIHGGHEMYHLPSPRMVAQYRCYAESGASVIIGHHTHCISGYEIHQDVPIFYGLGNFLFTEESANESWYIGLVLKLKFLNSEELKWELIPIKQDKGSYKLQLISGSEKQNVLSSVNQYSAIISNKKELLKNWEGFVQDKYDEVVDIFSPIQVMNNHYIIKVFQKFGLSFLFRRKKHYLRMLNHLRCESLSDLSKGVISKYLNDRE